MALIYMNGDLVELTSGIICYQANCKGIMPNGIPLQIKYKFPKVWQDYRTAYMKDQLHLGNIIETMISEKLHVISMCAQYSNSQAVERLYTNYNAVKNCLKGVKLIKEMHSLPVFFPYNMGCGKDGGNWNIMAEYIKSTLPDSFIIRST